MISYIILISFQGVGKSSNFVKYCIKYVIPFAIALVEVSGSMKEQSVMKIVNKVKFLERCHLEEKI